MSLKVLIISYTFYPIATPNSYRWFSIARKWKQEGAEVFVIEAFRSQDKKYEEIEGIKVYRATEYIIGKFRNRFRENRQSFKTTTLLHKKRFSARSIIRKIYNFFLEKIVWPDSSFLWYFSANSLAEKIIKEYKIEKVITVSWTFTAHLIGLKLKQKFPSVFWLADTIDTFALNYSINNSFLYKRLNKYFEKKVFSKADLNSVLTEKIKEGYVNLLPDLKNRIVVNPNIFVPTYFDYTKINKENDNKIKLLFLGTLSTSVRSPKNLLVLFSNMIGKYSNFQFRLDFYGDFSDTLALFQEQEPLLNHFVFLHHPVNREKVNYLIKEADVLVNIGNQNVYQEPSKLIEYIYSRKKILNIASIKEDTSIALLKNYPLKFNVFSDEIHDIVVLRNIFNFLIREEIIEQDIVDQLIKDYLLDAVADKYLNFINK